MGSDLVNEYSDATNQGSKNGTSSYIKQVLKGQRNTISDSSRTDWTEMTKQSNVAASGAIREEKRPMELIRTNENELSESKEIDQKFLEPRVPHHEGLLQQLEVNIRPAGAQEKAEPSQRLVEEATEVVEEGRIEADLRTVSLDF